MKKHEGDLSNYRAAFLDCRPGMSGHRWTWQTDFKIVRNTKGEITEFSRLRKCLRCKTTSVKAYDGKTGRLLRRSYTYPDGYTIDRNAFQFEPGMAALESLRRSMEANHTAEVVDPEG